MQLQSLFPPYLGSVTAAMFLTTIMTATFFTHASLAYPNRECPGSTHLDSIEVSSLKIFLQLLHPLGSRRCPAPSTCLFYTSGLHEPARYYAGQNNLTTIWDVYLDLDYGPNATKNFTETERHEYYSLLARQHAADCSGQVFAIMSNETDLCDDSLFKTEEIPTWNITKFTPIPYPFSSLPSGNSSGEDSIRHYDETHPPQLCNDSSRFAGDDPGHYWGN